VPGEPVFVSVLRFVAFVFTPPGMALICRLAMRKLIATGIIKKKKTDYDGWVRSQTESTAVLKDCRKQLTNAAKAPHIKIIINNLYRVDLEKTIRSLQAQVYDHWQAIILESAENVAALRIDGHKEKFSVFSSNDLLSSLKQDSVADNFYLFLDSGVALTPNCLFEFATFTSQRPEFGVVYTDEDIETADRKFTTPFFKPGQSPDSLLSRNYIGNNFFIEGALMQKILRNFPDTCLTSTYDILLKAATEKGFGHIAKVLFHLPAKSPEISLEEWEYNRQCLSRNMERQGWQAEVHRHKTIAGAFGIDCQILRPGKVSIIIPTKDQVQLLRNTIDSIVEQTDYPDYEIIVVNNNSISAGFSDCMQHYASSLGDKFRQIDQPIRFNFSKLINAGAAAANGEYLLMLNNDMLIQSRDWLHKMVLFAQRPHTGAVGVKLVFPDGTIQHAGIALGGNEVSQHLFLGEPSDTSAYHNQANLVSNFSALTGACLMCRKEAFMAIGGMDENLDVEYNDIDFCLKLMQQGLYNVYLPDINIIHFESATRGHPFKSLASWKKHVDNLNYFKNKWAKYIEQDPYWNSNNFIDFE